MRNDLAAPLDPACAVELHDVHKYFGDHHVLKGVSLRIMKGEVVVILGPSGGGKSTLLRTINHLEKPDRGWVKINGGLMGYRRDGDRLVELSDRETAAQRRHIGMVFQQFNLFSHMTALQNVMAAPIKVLKTEKEKAAADARRLLALVGLPEKENAYPEHLSGGQQQRVAIARALAMHPKVLLFDEPTSALDPEMVAEVLSVMLDLSKAGMTMVVVTHEIGFARVAAHRAVFVENGEIVEEAPPETFFANPASARTRQFLGKVLHG
jgi:polar amino acid transport system ATP-binding protein